MTLTFETKSVSDMTGAERRSCHAMSYLSDGDLSPWLRLATDDPQQNPAKVLLVREGQQIVGWAFRWDTTGAAGYWTRRSHRGRGIGTMMVEQTLKLGKISTHPHDYHSAKLFAKTNALPKGSVRTWKKHIRDVERGQYARSA